MTPSAILLIIQGITAAIAAAPGAIEIAVKAKEFIATLFSADAITKQQQDDLHAHIDEVCFAAIRGDELPHWQVEPDPA